jgi:hypothetical protein
MFGIRKKHNSLLKWSILIITASWTVAITASLIWNLIQAKRTTNEMALTEARVAYEKDVTYRRWNSSHGGVYAPVTRQTPPNPYMKHPERDIKTLTGKTLTLINPAYMNRQVHELEKSQSGVLSRITSLKPIRPDNAPDLWEEKALKAFEQGEPEISSVELLDGKEYFRLMKPLITEEECIQCHGKQGYKEGDIRGGISVSIPMKPLRAIAHRQKVILAIAHSLLCLLGIGGIGYGTKRINKDIAMRQRAEEEREKLIKDLQEALAKVKTLSGFLPICSSCKKIRDDKGYWNQIESYIRDHSEAEFSHSICPKCSVELYGERFKNNK